MSAMSNDQADARDGDESEAVSVSSPGSLGSDVNSHLKASGAIGGHEIDEKLESTSKARNYTCVILCPLRRRDRSLIVCQYRFNPGEGSEATRSIRSFELSSFD